MFKVTVHQLNTGKVRVYDLNEEFEAYSKAEF